jgi:alkylhydroperoxidase/carboxymuconolactone decarboxylase family protein YurZ
MVPTLFFYQLMLIALVWLCLMLQWIWPSAPALSPTTPELPPPRLKRKRAPKPFAGLTTQPPCDACEHAPDHPHPHVPSAPPNLDYQSRELATIAALASMPGTAGQLQFHLGAAMNTGLTAAQMQEFIAVLKSKVGAQEAESADAILGKVLSNRAK